MGLGEFAELVHWDRTRAAASWYGWRMTLDEHFSRMRAEGTRAAEHDFWRAVHAELWRSYRSEADYAVKQDLVSRALVVIVRRLPEFEPVGSDGCTRWVRKIAKLERLGREHEAMRAADARERLREWAAQLQRTSPLTWLLRQLNFALAKQLIATLATPQREALRHEDAQALADATGIGLRAARMRRRRALKQLADLLGTAPTRRRKRVRDITSS